MTDIHWRNLTKSDRCGLDGREIKCPHCDSVHRVGHLNWKGLMCCNCRAEVDKPDWLTQLTESEIKKRVKS